MWPNSFFYTRTIRSNTGIDQADIIDPIIAIFIIQAKINFIFQHIQSFVYNHFSRIGIQATSRFHTIRSSRSRNRYRPIYIKSRAEHSIGTFYKVILNTSNIIIFIIPFLIQEIIKLGFRICTFKLHIRIFDKNYKYTDIALRN